jgi:signal transduction histidine kinase
VEIALCFPRSAEYYKTTLEQVQATTVHMTALLESLLTLARADANVETISLTPVSLDLLVMEAADHWRPFTQRQGLTLSIVGNGAPRWVMGDITALRRCTAILMENACRYTESGTVEIGLEAEPGFVTLLVKDTGIGIAPQHMPHLFERFYRGNGARRANGFGEGEPHRAKNGSGLGLSLAKWIVDQHHAELLVESRLGAGSCFRIRLPACATTANASATSEAQILRAIE